MKETQQILRELGIHSTYIGYHYLSTTLEIALQQKHSISLYAKTIFPSVAQKYQTTPSRIERNIRTVIIIAGTALEERVCRKLHLIPYRKVQPSVNLSTFFTGICDSKKNLTQ